MCQNLGHILIELDISGCPSLTDASCKSMAQYCQCIEFIGMRNMRNITGTELCPLFEDTNRAGNIRYVAFSGSKDVSVVYINIIPSMCTYIDIMRCSTNYSN